MSISLDTYSSWPLFPEAPLFQYMQVSFHSRVSLLIPIHLGLFSQRQFSFSTCRFLSTVSCLSSPVAPACLSFAAKLPKTPLLTRGHKKKGRLLLRRSLHSSCGLLESKKSCAGDPQGRTGRFRCVLFVGLYFSISFFFPRDICKGAQSWYLVIFC